jgi:hypothetical protein
MYVWSGSAWVSVATEVESLAGFATQSYADNVAGMKLIVPSSIAVGSGTGSVGTQGTVTVSGASSVSLNNVFSSTYQNYRIVCNGTVANNAGSLQFRLRVAGVDSSTAYNRQRLNVSSTTFTGARATNQTAGEAGGFAQTYNNGITIDTFSPFEAKTTVFSCWGTDSRDNVQIEISQNIHTATTSYDGITFIGNGGNITGTFSVYGYKAG